MQMRGTVDWNVDVNPDGVDVKKYQFAFIWNGASYQTERMLNRIVEARIPHAILEVGWLPQDKHYHIDRSGICAKSSLMEKLDIVPNQLQYEELAQLKNKYRKGISNTKSNHVLVPLQLEDDVQIMRDSEIKDMNVFVEHVLEIRPGSFLLVKPHPRCLSYNVRSHPRIRVADSITSREAISFCDEVIGLNSTLLYEAYLCGKPTLALSNGLFKRWSNQLDDLIINLFYKQIPINVTDISWWLNQYCDFMKTATESFLQ
jgi:hypothetical protein